MVEIVVGVDATGYLLGGCALKPMVGSRPMVGCWIETECWVEIKGWIEHGGDIGGDDWIEIGGPANRLKPKVEATLKASMNPMVW